MARSGTLVNAIGATIVLTLALVVGRLWITRAASGSPIDSVAVLPFFNANAAPEVDYLADGIPESIINSLSQLPNLKVMSRTSAFQFKGREVIAQDVGQKLGVRRCSPDESRNVAMLWPSASSWWIRETTARSGASTTIASSPTYSRCKKKWPRRFPGSCASS